MPVYNEEYGTDWGKVLPEIGNQISSIIKNKREKPGLGAQKALEIASTNPDILKPENEAILAKLLGAEYTLEGVAAARSMAASPYFQEVVKAKIAGARMPGAQLGATEAGTAKTVQETTQMPTMVETELERTRAATENVRIAGRIEELTKVLGRDAAVRDDKLRVDVLTQSRLSDEAQAKVAALRVAEQNTAISAEERMRAAADARKYANDALIKSVDMVVEYNKTLTSEGFANMKDDVKAQILADGPTIMAGVIRATGDAQMTGVPGANVKTSILLLVKGLYFASGQDQAKFGENYTRFLAGLDDEMKNLVDSTFQQSLAESRERKALSYMSPEDRVRYGALPVARKSAVIDEWIERNARGVTSKDTKGKELPILTDLAWLFSPRPMERERQRELFSK